MDEIEQNWKDNWEEILMKDGVVDLEQLKKELFDFSNLINDATKVYCHVSGGRLSYPSYSAKTVISAYEDYIESLYEFWEEDFKEGNECTCGQ